MRFALDIDGTLGYRNRQQYLKTCNQVLKLAIAEERLLDMSLATFFRLPEVRAYRAHVGEDHYARAVGWIDFHPEVLCAMFPWPGARAGVSMLAGLGRVAYYTARYSAQSEELSEAMAQATLEWLATNAFENPTGTVFCDGLSGKLRQLVQAIERDPGPVILIDDQYARLLQKFTELDAEPARILEHSLILIAYGAQTVPEYMPVPVIALPSWKEEAVHHMLETVACFLDRKQEVFQ